MSTAMSVQVGLGALIRYRQPVNHVQVRGVVMGRVYTNDRPWLVVDRIKDGARVVVGLHEVVTVLEDAPNASAMLPVFEAVVPGAAVAPAPVVVASPVGAAVEVPEGPQIVFVPVPTVAVPAPVDAALEDRVRYLSPYGVMKVGVVVEIDTVSALIEVGKPSTLELIEIGDIHAVLA